MVSPSERMWIIFLVLYGTLIFLSCLNARFILSHQQLWTDPRRHEIFDSIRKFMTSGFRWGAVVSVTSFLLLPVPPTPGSNYVFWTIIYVVFGTILSYRTRKLLTEKMTANSEPTQK